ncbi:MAG: hypothetical protein ACYTFV_01110 [Planctomycetota bacterium]|jgi:hypothetical protein
MAIRRALVSPIRAIADNPWVNLTAGGAFGIIHALSALPEILHGFDEVLKAHDGAESEDEAKAEA